MAPTRHNLSRRALLGVGVGACALGADASAAPFALSLSGRSRPEANGFASLPTGQGEGELRQPRIESGAERVEQAEARGRWDRALAAYRRSEARLAAFQAEVALLPAERRAFPACRPLEQRFGDLDDRRFAMLLRLFRLPAPDLGALSLKLDLALADQAWEIKGAEQCLAVIAADARRLAGAGQ